MVLPRSCCGTALLVMAALALSAPTASAFSSGQSGASGKTGGSCNGCHQGGPTPNVKLEGPTAVEAGVPAVYTFFIGTSQKTTGMNAAATDDVVLTGDGDGGTTELEGAEIIHARTVEPVDGGALYTFSLTAPYGERITLYAAGNAVNGDGERDGDRAATTSLDIDVDGPARPPPPPPKPPATTPPPPPAAIVDAGTPSAPAATPAEDSGCVLARPGAGDASIAGGPALLALVLAARLARARLSRGKTARSRR